MIVAGNIEALDRCHVGWKGFGFGGQHIFEILVEIAFVTSKIIGAGAAGDPLGQTVPADTIQGRLTAHGVLPTGLFALGYLGLHRVVILAGRAVVIVVAAFKLDRAGLHPQAGIVGLGFFVRFDLPYLSAENCTDILFSGQIARRSFFI